MDAHGLALTTTAFNPSTVRSLFPSFYTPCRRRSRGVSYPRKSKYAVFASKDVPNLDQWEQMELKFGRMIGEDPKLTLAKIMGKKLNPDMTNLEIEKAFNKNKGKALYSDVEEVPFDVSRKGQSRNSSNDNSSNGLNLVRPVPKKGVKFETDNKPLVFEVKKPRRPLQASVDNAKGSLPNVILRKPTTFKEDDLGSDFSELRMKPNLYLNMGRGQTKENFTDITLLKKPEPLSSTSSSDEEQGSSANTNSVGSDSVKGNALETTSGFSDATNDMTLTNKPDRMNFNSADNIRGNDIKENNLEGERFSNEIDIGNSIVNESFETGDASTSRDAMLEDDCITGPQPLGQSDIRSGEETTVNEPAEAELKDFNLNLSVEAALQGKPKRLDQYVKGTSSFNKEEAVSENPESGDNNVELDNFLASSPIKQHEDSDWTRAEDLFKTGGRGQVEMISSSTRGFVVSFGSLVGFLPYRNLAARWKFLAFESWLRRKGVDPSLYKQSLGTIGSFDSTNKSASLGSSLTPEKQGEITPGMQLEDLLRIYDHEKLQFLSSFVGQKIKVNVVLADRRSRRLVFSVKPKEKEELAEKRRGLMGRLSVGDVVKCCIKKITYFGIFVEVEGVPALIHQTEVSWDATLDPSSYFKVGQILDAKVHQLDFSMERIFLSLKEVTPDPLTEALEAVIGDHDSLDGKLEAAEADSEWDEVESLIKELQQFEGIQSVSKGRFFLSPGLAPTFQVYMASMFENQYKLLARSGNRVQEVIVQTSLDKEEMKSAIMTCTNRVE